MEYLKKMQVTQIKLDNNELLNLIKNESFNFTINPLDLGLVSIQYRLMNKFKETFSTLQINEQIYEEFHSKDPSLNISSIKVICERNKQKKFNLNFIINKQNKQYFYSLANKDDKELLNAISTKFFIKICKIIISKIPNDNN